MSYVSIDAKFVELIDPNAEAAYRVPLITTANLITLQGQIISGVKSITQGSVYTEATGALDSTSTTTLTGQVTATTTPFTTAASLITSTKATYVAAIATYNATPNGTNLTAMQTAATALANARQAFKLAYRELAVG